MLLSSVIKIKPTFSMPLIYNNPVMYILKKVTFTSMLKEKVVTMPTYNICGSIRMYIVRANILA